MRHVYFFIIYAALIMTGCTTVKSALALNNSDAENDKRPISNPFGDTVSNQSSSSGSGSPNQNMILRTKKGDRAVEIELPNSGENISDFVVPVSPAFKDNEKKSAATEIDESYKDRPPTFSDREITSRFPQGAPDDDGKRRDIEQGLGLTGADDVTPENPKSYLAAVAYIKQLYLQGKYEQALIETDGLIRQYQTSPQLYQMRGTLLDRLGKTDLALKSWNQALRFDPGNQALHKFVERRQHKRGVASQ